MTQQPSQEPKERFSPDELNLMTLDIVQKLQTTYEPGLDRVVTPDNVYQPAIVQGRDHLETFQNQLLLPGSGVFGLENLEQCMRDLSQGRTVLFLADHRGNLDVPSFNALLRREGEKFEMILERLIYIAGRKLNESSDFIKMFTEKYSRLVIVPKRDFPKNPSNESDGDAAARDAFEKEAAKINRAAFRNLIRLKKSGHIFVLFPLGGRWKPEQDNIPVAESTSYISSFDVAYLVSMEGNTLPVKERMEDERPVQDKVVFRVGPQIFCKQFLGEQRERHELLLSRGEIAASLEYDQFVVERIMAMLKCLRETGRIVPEQSLSN